MARRRKKNKGLRLLVVAGLIGGGAWWLWKSGKWQQFYDTIMPQPPPDENGNGEGGEKLPIDDDGNIVVALGAGFAAILKWLEEHGDKEINPPDPPLEPPDPPPVDPEPWTFKLPEWLAGVPAGGAALTLAQTLELGAKAAIPLIIGTSPAVARLVHNVNVAIPGANTGLEKGNVTVFDERGRPVIVTPEGECFDLAGRPRTCPAPVTGISQPVLDYIGV